MKKLDKWGTHELNDSQKDDSMKSDPRLCFATEIIDFLFESWCITRMDPIRKYQSGQWLNKVEAQKHFLKPSLHTRKVMVPIWTPIASVIPLQIPEFRWNHYSGNVLPEIRRNAPEAGRRCPPLVNRKISVIWHNNAQPHGTQLILQKLNAFAYETLLHPPLLTRHSPTDYHCFKQLDHFLRDEIFVNLDGVGNAFWEFVASRSSNFYLTGITKH